jgi:methylated-DNA-[protein]-cysteine S-methyltransferase
MDQVLRNMEIFSRLFASPVGDLFIAVSKAGALVRLEYRSSRSIEEIERKAVDCGDILTWDSKACEAVCGQLDEYFHRRRRQFELTLEPRGTLFQQRVWQELLRIPYGETVSYSELAKRLGDSKAVRAVGGANAVNPIAIVIPCHRVIGANRRLTGYGGGLNVKQHLLALEGFLLF